ncbi:MAG TPA: hypothetical protein VKP14_07725 [Gaiellaceae bacterium]|nr:hypothetical protein [Gaiellaceae bacterium]
MFEFLGGEAVVVAAFAAVALAGVADVVGVAAAVAVGGGTDVALAAARALDQAGEEVVGVVGAPERCVPATLGEDLLGALEQFRLDERRVRRLVGLAAEGDLAQVAAVSEDVEDGVGGEGFAGAGAVATLVQPVGERGGALEAFAVAVEDLLHDGCFGRVGFEVAAVGVVAVAEGDGAADPFAAGGFAFHAGDDALDDGGAFELGEDAEHLHHHPPRRGGGVEWLRRAAEEDARVIELLEDLGEAADRA